MRVCSGAMYIRRVFADTLRYAHSLVNESIAPWCADLVAAGTSVLRFIDRISLRLVISPEGIGYIGVGYRIFSPWENVAGMGVRKVASEVHEGREIWGLMLSQPAPVFKVRAWARYLMGWKDAEASFIPVSDFAGYPDELAQHIQYYVPAFSGL